MNANQLQRVCNACIERCTSGNTWPPDLAEFVALVAECGGGVLGVTVADVLAELARYRNESYRYTGADDFPWSSPVLYHICIDLKRLGVEKKLTDAELRTQAGLELVKWEKHVASGAAIPAIRRRLDAPKHPAGPTPAQELYAKYLQRKAGGQS